MKETRVELHKKTRKEIENENKFVSSSLKKLDHEIEKNIKKLYVAFPQLNAQSEKKINEQNNLIKRTYIFNGDNKNIEITLQPSIEKLLILNDEIEEYRKKYTISDLKLNSFLNEIKESVLEKFPKDYESKKQSLKSKKLLLEKEGIDEINELRRGVHEKFISLIELIFSDNNNNEAEKFKRKEIEELMKILVDMSEKESGIDLFSFKNIFQKIKDISNMKVKETNFKFWVILLILGNIIVLSGVGIGIWIWLA